MAETEKDERTRRGPRTKPALSPPFFALKREVVTLVIHQYEGQVVTFARQRSRPAHFFHLVHPLEAKHNPVPVLQPAIDLAILQPYLVITDHVAAFLAKPDVRCHLHREILFVEVRTRD